MNTSRVSAQWRGLEAFLLVFFVVILSACTSTPRSPALVYLPTPPIGVAPVHSPVFLVDDGEQPFNRIGTPTAQEQGSGDPLVLVDPAKASIYFEKQQFTTTKGSYTNLIYRLHFSEVPFLWTSPHLTAGNNPGLLIIYTLDQASTLLLVTSVHTCGCFFAFTPTSAMPPSFFPDNWSVERQEVYGQSLPGLLPLPTEASATRLLFSLESETHRIREAAAVSAASLEQFATDRNIAMRPMRDLYALPYREGIVSFFEDKGPRQGYVKNNTKIWERLLMSWWAFDLYVGEDKAYSLLDKSDTVFYTSLKFWARKDSDLKKFPQFLTYWGWQL
jgi:hypothetical protein